MNGITRKPAFWIAFAVVSALSGAFAWRYFPAALPLINLDVKMTRGDALARAATIADRLDARAGRRAACRAVRARWRDAEFCRVGSRRQTGLCADADRHAVFAVLVGGAAVQARRDRRGARAFSSGRHGLRIHAQGPGERAWRCARCRGGARDRRSACADRLGDRLRAVQAARAVTTTTTQRPDRPQFRLRARA